MKKSVEILGLPIISITEGRELGVSKTLLIDAKNGVVAAITIEDEDWYRGVKLIPYESVIAIGEDAVTITHSENILKLDEAGDYERFLVENIRVIGTKAITKKGRIQGTVTEVFIGDGGKIEQCEITAADGSTSEVAAAQISIFGKQVTVVDIDGEKKNNFVTEPPAFEPADNEPAQEVWTPAVDETPAEPVETPEIPETPFEPVIDVEMFSKPAETEDAVEIPDTPAETVDTAEILDTPAETVDAAEILDTPAETVDAAEILDTPAETVDAAEIPDTPAETVDTAILDAPIETVETKPEESAPVETVEKPEPAPAETAEALTPAVEEKPPVETNPSAEEQKIVTMTQQAKDLKAALKKALNDKQAAPKSGASMIPPKTQVEPTVVERRRRALLGKHATKTITAESGTVVVEAGAEVTEEVLQRARLSNKFIELSMTVQ